MEIPLTVPKEALAPILTALGTLVGYVIGRRQEADKVRITQAFSRAEEVSSLILTIRDTEEGLADWYRRNFTPQLSFPEAMERIETRGTFESERARVDELLRSRHTLVEKVRLARVYLNPSDMDRIVEYINLGSFTFSHDGVGGILFDTRYRAFFANLLDSSLCIRRAALFGKIKKRLNKMHRTGWLS
jgi:hypothetical protein